MSGSAHAMPVTLGLLRLAALEVPVSYSRGATMQPLVHRLIGGGRVVQLMGEDPQVRELEGCFVGPNAVDRALTLEAMRDAGLPVMLTIGAWSELVIITVVTLIYTSRGAVIAYRLRAEAVASQIGLIVQTVSSIAQAALLDLGQAAASTGVGVGLAVPATASMGQAASALGVGAGGLQASYAAGAPALDHPAVVVSGRRWPPARTRRSSPRRPRPAATSTGRPRASARSTERRLRPRSTHRTQHAALDDHGERHDPVPRRGIMAWRCHPVGSRGLAQWPRRPDDRRRRATAAAGEEPDGRHHDHDHEIAVSLTAQPAARLVIAGVACGTCLEVELEASSSMRASTFQASIALDAGDPGVTTLLANLGTGALPGLPIEIDMGFTAADGSVVWQTMIVGTVDAISMDVLRGVVELEGRDLLGRLIDMPISDEFLNQTSSDIVTTLAARAGLIAEIEATSSLSGQYYQINHSRTALNAFTRFSTAWDLICNLAETEGFDCWVAGSTLNFSPPTSIAANVVSIDVPTLQAGGIGTMNLTNLRFDRRLALDQDVQVTVRSWNSRQKAVIEQAYPSNANVSPSSNFVFVVPNATDDTALAKATALYQNIARHGRVVSGEMAGDLSLMPRAWLTVTGSVGDWDGQYVVDTVIRRMSARGGFNQSFIATSAP